MPPGVQRAGSKPDVIRLAIVLVAPCPGAVSMVIPAYALPLEVIAVGGPVLPDCAYSVPVCTKVLYVPVVTRRLPARAHVRVDPPVVDDAVHRACVGRGHLNALGNLDRHALVERPNVIRQRRIRPGEIERDSEQYDEGAGGPPRHLSATVGRSIYSAQWCRPRPGPAA